jgi:hypothetical protein
MGARSTEGVPWHPWNAPAMPAILERWVPSPERVEAANVTRFARLLGVDGYAGLLGAAAADLPGFYERLVGALDLRWDAPWTSVLDCSRGAALATWFPGARINAAANCLDRHVDAGRGADEALVWEGEDGHVRRFSFAELRDAVARLGGVLQSCGIRSFRRRRSVCLRSRTSARSPCRRSRATAPMRLRHGLRTRARRRC